MSVSNPNVSNSSYFHKLLIVGIHSQNKNMSFMINYFYYFNTERKYYFAWLLVALPKKKKKKKKEDTHVTVIGESQPFLK